MYSVSSMNGRPSHVLPLESQKSFTKLDELKAAAFLHQHVNSAGYLLRPEAHEAAADDNFTSNNGLWEAILYARAHAEKNVRLDSFFLFEWVPRAPGLWWTDEGRQARRNAERSIASVEDGVVIYQPWGKASMLEGGVGNLRLRPVRVEGRMLYIMSASSSGVCHEGFPVALPPSLYGECIAEIKERGAVARDIIGRLRFLPKSGIPLHPNVLGVPQLYLDVEELRPASHPVARGLAELHVTVGASFTSEFEGQSAIYACYAGFDPGKRESLESCVRWMAHDYVGTRYRGTIVSDFDEQVAHFPDAPFGLNKVMRLRLKKSEMATVLGDANLANDFYQFQELVYIDRRTYMHNEANISGSSNVNLAQGQGITQVVSQQLDQSGQRLEITELVKQLAKQIEEAAPKMPEAEAKSAVANVKRLSNDLSNADAEPGWFQASLQGIKKAAEAVGEIGVPIVEIVIKLMPLLLGGG
jgi:hypothetical protein